MKDEGENTGVSINQALNSSIKIQQDKVHLAESSTQIYKKVHTEDQNITSTILQKHNNIEIHKKPLYRDDVNLKRTIPYSSMFDKNRFVFGRNTFHPTEIAYWDFDACNNYHMAVTGGSGSGKTILVVPIIQFLGLQGMNIHVLDLKGDLGTKDERYFEFTARKSKYGINPFEFDLNLKNGGPRAQAFEIIRMFKKTFMSSMKEVQQGVLIRLILDTYSLKGFKEDDESTWGDPEELAKNKEKKISWIKNLPNIEDMLSLLKDIKTMVMNGLSVEFNKSNHRMGKTLSKWSLYKKKLNDDIVNYTDKLIDSKNPSEKTRLQRIIGEKQEKLSELAIQIEDQKSTMLKDFGDYIDATYLDLGPEIENQSDEIKINGYEDIDLTFYSIKENIKVLNSLTVHLTNLVDSGIFNNNIPPVGKGVNRYDISGLPQNIQAFFVDVMISKIFRALRNRGKYMDLPLSHRTKHGKKGDTFIVVDEVQLIVPKGAEAKDPTSTQNRIVSESRGYGLGFIVLTQTVNNLPELFLTNIATKIVLKTEFNDIPPTVKALGMDKKLLDIAGKTFGVAIINMHGHYKTFNLPWANV